ncbi:hypothetical protein PTTG_07592 [Puccinia triticina 1-1 BBBD Race 1]|uniref:2',3'-cyclic-nucleotide 3'-phosphodiesterase n=2 Tax=Puccinia triticina TaxID=208348 RepID=A0A0C4F3B5_PUCT1|nr:uncharacterized protein PtA15_5A820 [Puccinia triticina]OAV90413.1 hypothetical protein PTTG_07592 [Puccinia triticina 1-1 BBBD Race 1]WAQ85246.1 hypothetical protein PtA15_5A820 [Puccinia triticina]WAR58567.1 hypothetical protein PtB15_5B801 [Puccinia triticina]
MADPIKLSLWLSPTGAAFDRLKTLIDTLASETEGCLAFDPHLTLISDDQVPRVPLDQVLQVVSESVKKWRSTLSEGDQLELKFQKIQSGEMFYQCVLAAVVPSEMLKRLNNELRESLVTDPAARAGFSRYFPHLSIVYGDLSQQQKDGLVVRATSALSDMPGFIPTEILVVKTSGPSSEWAKLAKISLQDGSIEALS